MDAPLDFGLILLVLLARIYRHRHVRERIIIRNTRDAGNSSWKFTKPYLLRRFKLQSAKNCLGKADFSAESQTFPLPQIKSTFFEKKKKWQSFDCLIKDCSANKIIYFRHIFKMCN